jgi:hypothetical protein
MTLAKVTINSLPVRISDLELRELFRCAPIEFEARNPESFWSTHDQVYFHFTKNDIEVSVRVDSPQELFPGEYQRDCLVISLFHQQEEEYIALTDGQLEFIQRLWEFTQEQERADSIAPLGALFNAFKRTHERL